MSFRPFLSSIKSVIGVLAAVLFLIAGFIEPGVFETGNSTRQKPMSAEAKFLWLVFGLLLIIGFTGWWIWHHVGTH